MFDEPASWYLPSPPIPHDSIPIFEEEVNEAEMPPHDDNIEALSESLISFRLTGPYEGLSRNDQPIEETTSSEDLAVLSPHKELRRWLTRKEKGKKKMLE